MQNLDVTVAYDLVAEGPSRDSNRQWLVERLTEVVEADMGEGVMEFEVRPGEVRSSYDGPAFRGETGTLVLHFLFYSFSDEEYEADNEDDPSTDAEYLEGVVKESFGPVFEGASWGDMKLFMEVEGSVVTPGPKEYHG